MEKKAETKDKAAPMSFWVKATALFRSETVRFILGLLVVIFSVYLLLAFTSFFFTGAADQSIIDNATEAELAAVDNGVKNYAGSRGAQLSSFLINDCFGVASFFIIVFLAAVGFRLMKVGRVRLWRWFIICFVLLVWFSVFLGFAFRHVYQDSFVYLGGLHGYNVGLWLESQVGTPGVWLILLAVAVCFLAWVSARTVVWMRRLLSLGYLKKQGKPAGDGGEKPSSPGETPEEFDTSWGFKRKKKDESRQEPVSEPEPDPVSEGPIDLPVEPRSPRKAKEDEVAMDIEVPQPEEPVAPVARPATASPEPAFDVEVNQDEYATHLQEPYNPRLDLENYHFPTLDLLKEFDESEPVVNMDEQNANKDEIVTTLRSFGIEINSIKATVGPTVTLYEITLERGVRISRIKGLENDIALALSALGIRIIAPIPGKGTIGIEVPNKKPRIVSGRSIIGSKKFQESTYDLPIALGKTITNEVFMVDLAKMPHILVAGATGQGKSVGLNAIITSLLYKKHPAELKFVLVDPKKVEFSIYSVIEHHFLAKLVRNVKEYNEKFINRQLNPEKGHKYMPYIVVVIDEFGDLIMTAGKDVELPIARIAQLARAVGIHMIIATQRPTTNIITGTIKANFPARIAFRVSQMVDSRTILDRPGANQLIGHGDMLFLQGADPVRVQCAFIDTPEVANITEYIARQQGYPTAFFLPEVEDESASNLDDVDMDRLDPLFKDAARLIVSSQQGSTSLIQRKFSIGYNRAGRIMDQLEKANVVGSAQGSKPREVLFVDIVALEEYLNNF